MKQMPVCSGQEAQIWRDCRTSRKNGPLDLSIAIRSEGTVVQLRADSNVADKWINGHYAMGKRYKDNIGGIRGRRRKLLTSWCLIDDNVKHHFREHKQEADHFAKL